VILDVAKGHQRYFGMRDTAGRLLPRYLAVVGTALRPDNIRRGNDRVMRARLADAKFFYDEDRKLPLGDRRPALDGIVFHKRLGSVGDKVRRIERLIGLLGSQLELPAETLRIAARGAALCKCDLVTLMVGELPELQGEMGRAYALAQGIAAEVADVIAEHYQPRNADDPPAPSQAGALVAIADRLDTLAGCFAIGLVPTGAADPLALRRAGIGLLKTLLAQSWDLALALAIREAFAGYSGVRLELGAGATTDKLIEFLCSTNRRTSWMRAWQRRAKGHTTWRSAHARSRPSSPKLALSSARFSSAPRTSPRAHQKGSRGRRSSCRRMCMPLSSAYSTGSPSSAKSSTMPSGGGTIRARWAQSPALLPYSENFSMTCS
jgi:glycyl-tRNA synthetase beta subunit